MPIDRTVKVFNQDFIQQWEADVQFCQTKLAGYGNRVAELTHAIAVGVARIEELEHESSRLAKSIQRLTTKKRSNKESPLIDTNTQLTDLKTQQQENERIMMSFKWSRDNDLKEVDRIQSLIQITKFNIEDLSNSYSKKAKEFLTRLEEKPQLLCESAAETIHNMITNYEKKYPLQQNIEVRFNLHRMKVHTDHILSVVAEKETKYESPETSARRWQYKYALLCGMLWYTLDRVQGSDKNLLAQQLIDVLAGMHIAENGNLPDNMAIRDHLSLAARYENNTRTINDKMRQVLVNDEDAFRRHEQEQFEIAFNELYELGPGRARAVYAFIDQYYLQRLSETQRDYKFYTTLVNAVCRVYREPTQADTDYLQFLATQVPGEPSVVRKLQGIVTGIVGMALAVVSGVIAYASFNQDKMDPSLIFQVNLSVVKGLSLFGFFGGLAGMGKGFYNYVKGERHGMSLYLTRAVDPVRHNKPVGTAHDDSYAPLIELKVIRSSNSS